MCVCVCVCVYVCNVLCVAGEKHRLLSKVKSCVSVLIRHVAGKATMEPPSSYAYSMIMANSLKRTYRYGPD